MTPYCIIVVSFVLELALKFMLSLACCFEAVEVILRELNPVCLGDCSSFVSSDEVEADNSIRN